MWKFLGWKQETTACSFFSRFYLNFQSGWMTDGVFLGSCPTGCDLICDRMTGLQVASLCPSMTSCLLWCHLLSYGYTQRSGPDLKHTNPDLDHPDPNLDPVIIISNQHCNEYLIHSPPHRFLMTAQQLTSLSILVFTTNLSSPFYDIQIWILSNPAPCLWRAISWPKVDGLENSQRFWNPWIHKLILLL